MFLPLGCCKLCCNTRSREGVSGALILLLWRDAQWRGCWIRWNPICRIDISFHLLLCDCYGNLCFYPQRTWLLFSPNLHQHLLFCLYFWSHLLEKGNSSLWFLRKLILHIHISCVLCGEGGASFRNKPHHTEMAKDRCEPCNHALSVILWALLLMLVCVWARSRAPVDKPRQSPQWKDLCSVQHVWPSWKSTIYWK